MRGLLFGVLIATRISHSFPLHLPVLQPQQVTVDQDEEPWIVYEAGPKNVLCPLICLPPVCGTADCFFYIVMKLAAKGYRVISVSLLLELLLNLGALAVSLPAAPSVVHHIVMRPSVVVFVCYCMCVCVCCLCVAVGVSCTLDC